MYARAGGGATYFIDSLIYLLTESMSGSTSRPLPLRPSRRRDRPDAESLTRHESVPSQISKLESARPATSEGVIINVSPDVARHGVAGSRTLCLCLLNASQSNEWDDG